mmetsp:Transcript_11797/g.10027  ORF Transcript_11797/g.10027 Transcript_11797/m.10027 type:complete len:103 (+) Transcript_11797:351-659(+)
MHKNKYNEVVTLLKSITPSTLTAYFSLSFWGTNSFGESNMPHSLVGTSDSMLPLGMSLGGGHSCILSHNSRLKCWGCNWHHEVTIPRSIINKGMWKVALGAK